MHTEIRYSSNVNNETCDTMSHVSSLMRIICWVEHIHLNNLRYALTSDLICVGVIQWLSNTGLRRQRVTYYVQ